MFFMLRVVSQRPSDGNPSKKLFSFSREKNHGRRDGKTRTLHIKCAVHPLSFTLGITRDLNRGYPTSAGGIKTLKRAEKMGIRRL